MSAAAVVETTVPRALADPLDYPPERPVSAEGLRPMAEGEVIRNGDGQVLVAYLRLWHAGDPPLERLRAALLSMRITGGFRKNGLRQASTYFGSLPRNDITTMDYCRLGQVDVHHPEVAAALQDTGRELEQVYKELAPAIYRHHAMQAERIAKAWRMPDLRCFTGGVVNKDNAIGWHVDRGNFEATFSGMPVVRNGMGGGVLCVPELGVHCPAADGTAVFFDGQSLVHGVTPLIRRVPDAYRFSAVFYSATALWRCLPPADEERRHQRRRTGRERRRAGIG